MDTLYEYLHAFLSFSDCEFVCKMHVAHLLHTSSQTAEHSSSSAMG